MNGARSNIVVRRATAVLALLSAPFAAVDRAGAVCALNNTIVTCSGPTINQNDPNGFGTGVETGDTIDVQLNASVTGTDKGISVLDGTINNLGTISGGLKGISTGTAITVINSGRIEATGTGDAISAATSATVTNNINAIISSASRGIAADTTIVVTANSGTIEATGTNGRALFAATNATVANTAGIIRADSTGGIGILAVQTATVSNGTGSLISGNLFGIAAGTLDVTNSAGGSISGGTTGITGSGTVTNAGTISGGTNSLLFNGTSTNTLILQTGSLLNGAASGSAVSANNNLVLQGSGIATNNFLGFNTLDVRASSAWLWNTNATIGATTISGMLAVNGALTSPVIVNSGGALAGQGTITGNVSAASGGAIAPGAAVPFSTLTVAGRVTFQPGSVFRVNVNATGQSDKLVVTGTNAADLTGGTVNVLAQNGSYAPSTQYKILTVDSLGVGGGNKFSNVTTNLAFLTPSLSYDPNGADVFLTLTAGGTGTFGFSDAA